MLEVKENVVEENMDGKDVLKYGKKIPCFLGVYLLKDVVTLNITKNDVSFIIIHNEHAVAIHITLTTIEVFEPLGFENKVIVEPICTFLKTHLPCKTLYINSKVQSDTSIDCAKYCLLFIYLRCKNYSFYKVLSLFSCDLEHNNIRLNKLFDRFFR